MADKKQNTNNTMMPMHDGQMMDMTIEEAERMMREQHGGDVREMERGKMNQMMNQNQKKKSGNSG